MFKTHRTYTLTTGVKNSAIAVIADGARVDVVYHKTLVVSKRGKTLTLRNGGWDTLSTRAVINTALTQLAHAGYVHRKHGETLVMFKDGTTRPFVSGMRLKVAS